MKTLIQKFKMNERIIFCMNYALDKQQTNAPNFIMKNWQTKQVYRMHPLNNDNNTKT